MYGSAGNSTARVWQFVCFFYMALDTGYYFVDSGY